jgi:hypothetical protein
MTCDRLGLIGKTMFAIDGVKLPANASKERSGTHAELAHRAHRLDKAAPKIIALHQAQDEHGESLDTQRQCRVDELRREAQVTRDFLATNARRLNRKGQELKTNLTDPDSAKMATGKGVIQGYAAQAAVDSDNQIIVAADITGSGSEQSMLLPMIEQATLRDAQTLITADAGYYSDDNVRALHERGIPRSSPTTPCARGMSASTTCTTRPRARCCTTSARRSSRSSCTGPSTSSSTATTPPPARPARPSPATAAITRTPPARGCSSSRHATKTARAAPSDTAA